MPDPEPGTAQLSDSTEAIAASSAQDVKLLGPGMRNGAVGACLQSEPQLPPALNSSAPRDALEKADVASAAAAMRIVTTLRGADLLGNPLLNKGTAFSREERRRLGLEGLLPWQVETLDQQLQRCRTALAAMGSDLERYTYLQSQRESNLVLFHRLLESQVETLLPVVYTPTVGLAIQSFSRIYRTPSHGIYLCSPQRDRLEAVLQEAMEGFSPQGPEWRPQLLLVTDAEGILGIGDQGAGGIHICLGKLAVYTLCAGVDPSTTLPVMLDVGTDREDLRADPCYPGLRQPRLRGAAYDAFLEAFVEAVTRICPGALVQWEDFGVNNARRVLDAYRNRIPSFNDDIQGTSGVACAAVLAGLKGLGKPLAEATIVIFGAGTAGCGVATGLERLLVRAGLTAEQARQRLWLIDRPGLLHQDLATMPAAARPYARDPAELSALGLDPAAPISLQSVVEAVRPAVLIGTSTVAGAFDRQVVRALCAGVERPIVLPLSNPTPLAEVTPENLLAWSDGQALVATGSPFGPVFSRGRERRIGQCNNCFIFPGLGYGALAVGARLVSDDMIDAALEALAERIPAARDPDAALMPSLADVQDVSAHVAEAVAIAALEEGLATRARNREEVRRNLAAGRWRPAYPEIDPV
ncbi:MAG: NAD-dependent malic enzyme [Cyanobacteriota bacterium]|nr:NAD-dependent malic enzyme [Cyanobacteriota bacterium]